MVVDEIKVAPIFWARVTVMLNVQTVVNACARLAAIRCGRRAQNSSNTLQMIKSEVGQGVYSVSYSLFAVFSLQLLALVLGTVDDAL